MLKFKNRNHQNHFQQSSTKSAASLMEPLEPRLFMSAAQPAAEVNWTITYNNVVGGGAAGWSGTWNATIPATGGSAAVHSSGGGELNITVSGNQIRVDETTAWFRDGYGDLSTGTVSGSSKITQASGGFAASGKVSGVLRGAAGNIADAGTFTATAQYATFDGTVPAPGTTASWNQTINPPVRGNPSNPSRSNYLNVINQFAVQYNPRYTPHGGQTYCNIFVQDVMYAMGLTTQQFPSMLANDTLNWLDNHGRQQGWLLVSAASAQNYANLGYPAIALGDGHEAVIRPGLMDPNSGDEIAQAGSKNYDDAHISLGWTKAQMSQIQYWMHAP